MYQFQVSYYHNLFTNITFFVHIAKIFNNYFYI
nr:MAG TPA_asm: hypothetical protein [Bacteriophage sp.]